MLSTLRPWIFSVSVVTVAHQLQVDRKKFILSKQLIRAGTSVGENIAEVNGAISEADFRAKLSIVYKESLETKYWLDLLNRVNLLSKKDYDALFALADELSATLYSAIRSTARKQ